jgi:hypothetical protein
MGRARARNGHGRDDQALTDEALLAAVAPTQGCHGRVRLGIQHARAPAVLGHT